MDLLTILQIRKLISSELDFRGRSIIFFELVILLVVLYGFETWSLILREDRKLGVYENRVLRRVFGPKRDKVGGEKDKLHNEELNDLYSHEILV